MKLLIAGVAGLIGLSACNGELVVGDASGGSSGAGAPGSSTTSTSAEEGGALGAQGGAPGAQGGALGAEGGAPGAEGGAIGAQGGALGAQGGALGAQGGASGGANVPADCSVSPAGYETYSTPEELNALLVGRWRRCLDPQIAGEDVGVEFTEDGKIFPLTTDENQQVVRRTGVDYEKTWVYSAPGSEDPISHAPSVKGFIMLDGVLTDPPTFTVAPRQLRLLFTPFPSKYVPLLP